MIHFVVSTRRLTLYQSTEFMSDFLQATEVIKNGGVILYPTDTIWGLGCDPSNDEAVRKVMKIKQRDESKSFILLVDSIPMLERFVPEFPEICYDLIETAIDPLTIIYPTSKGLSNLVTAADGSIGIRVTNDPFCKKLIQTMRKPILSTSANISGESFPMDFDSISPEIKDQVDFVLNNPGFKSSETPSKIIKIAKNGEIELIRR
jgi:L-threonylcarbamoyladenylate synthase